MKQNLENPLDTRTPSRQVRHGHYSLSDQDKEIKQEIELDHDDFSFNFSPITEGLGFHQVVKTEAEARLDKQRNPTSSKPERVERIDRLERLERAQARQRAMTSVPRSAREIVSDYTTTQINTEGASKRAQKIDFIPDRPVYEDAPMSESIFSWAIDMGLLVVFFLSSFAAMVMLLGIDWRVIERLFLFQENLIVVFYLFLVFKFLYFSIFNLNASLGKGWLNLRLVTHDQYPVTLKQSCFRAFVGTLSLFALGLPFFLGWVDRLTDTKIITLKK